MLSIDLDQYQIYRKAIQYISF